MDFIKKISPEFFLRVGLGLTYVFSAHDIFFHHQGWLWAIRVLPQSLQGIINQFGVVNFLKIQAVLELTMATFFLAFLSPINRLNSRRFKVGATFLLIVFFSALYYIVGQLSTLAFTKSFLVAAIFIPIVGWLEGGRLIRFVSILAALEMFLILLFVGLNAVTFRDLGLLGAALALFVMTFFRPSPTQSFS